MLWNLTRGNAFVSAQTSSSKRSTMAHFAEQHGYWRWSRRSTHAPGFGRS